MIYKIQHFGDKSISDSMFRARYRVVFRIFKANKFALLWGEAQLCLPYVC